MYCSSPTVSFAYFTVKQNQYSKEKLREFEADPAPHWNDVTRFTYQISAPQLRKGTVVASRGSRDNIHLWRTSAEYSKQAYMQNNWDQ